jgi:hypothetical protein
MVTGGLVQGALSAVSVPPEARLQSRVDDYFARSATKYKVNGREVSVFPFFRLGWAKPADAMHIPSSVKDAQVRAALGPKAAALGRAVHNAVWGRPTPAELGRVTQALIDAGKLDELRRKYDAMSPAEFQRAHGRISLPLSDQHAIQLLQWEYGLGVDCAGYVQQAFLDVHGGTRAKYEFESIGNEPLRSLQGNPAFDRATTPVDARPGDLIIMKPQPDDPGRAHHTVLVRDRHVLTPAEGGSLGNLGAFQRPGEVVHRVEVHSSWGSNNGNLEKGGVQSRVFLYNESSGKWADVVGGTVHPQASGVYNGHPIEGIYHPKR